METSYETCCCTTARWQFYSFSAHVRLMSHRLCRVKRVSLSSVEEKKVLEFFILGNASHVEYILRSTWTRRLCGIRSCRFEYVTRELSSPVRASSTSHCVIRNSAWRLFFFWTNDLWIRDLFTFSPCSGYHRFFFYFFLLFTFYSIFCIYVRCYYLILRYFVIFYFFLWIFLNKKEFEFFASIFTIQEIGFKIDHVSNVLQLI